MSNEYRMVLVATYKDDESAASAMSALRQSHRAGHVRFLDAALVTKNDEGKLHIHEDEPGALRGAAEGGVIGGLIGLVLGPLAIATAAIGAAIGAAAEKLHDAGIPDEQLDQLGKALKANRGAVVVQLNADDAPAVRAQLEQSGAQHIDDGINEDVLVAIMAEN